MAHLNGGTGDNVDDNIGTTSPKCNLKTRNELDPECQTENAVTKVKKC